VGTTFRFLGEPSEVGAVLDWFSGLPERPESVPSSKYTAFFFRTLGPILMGADGRIDQPKSPIVSVYLPRRRRDVLLTAGEVHFLPTPLRTRFPALDSVSKRFRSWLSQFPIVFSGSSVQAGDFDHYLEGSLRNNRIPIYALPLAKAALDRGQYFVADDDTDFVVEKLCRTLRLRGIQCGDA